MKRMFLMAVTGVGLLLSPPLHAEEADPGAAKLFAEHCAECHGPDRLGLIGPALLPENLRRLRRLSTFSEDAATPKTSSGP